MQESVSHYPETLSGVFERVLELQKAWDQRLSDPVMVERGGLITDTSRQLLQQMIKSVDDVGFDPHISGSNGFGGAARIPWVRLYSQEHSPSATSGWYLCYLFSAEGSALYLALMQGVTDFKSKSTRESGIKNLAEAAADARRIVGQIVDHRVGTEIELHDPRQQRGRQYENSTVYAIRYDATSVPPDEVLKADLLYMLRLLALLYESQALDESPLEQTQEEPDDYDKPAHHDEPIRDPWQALLTDTLWDEDELQEIVDTLRTSSKQIILAGPPGTGKTRLALALSAYLTEGVGSATRLVQFHPNYGYEEFVEGLRPVNIDGLVSFEVQPGLLRQISSAATQSKAPFVLIVDEMNRANLPRVFGELMFLLEYRDTEIDLQYTQSFQLPANLMFIGTMNTADRSIRSIDIALRRRFVIFECPPNADILHRYYEKNGQNEVVGLVEGFQALNEKLTSYLDKHHTIGHTFFMQERMTSSSLRRIWRRQIAPLIEEYFFDQPDIVAEFGIEQFWPNQ
jgi:MoxR-like ATPase